MSHHAACWICGGESAFVAGRLAESNRKKAPMLPDVGRGPTYSVPVRLRWAERGDATRPISTR